MSSQLHLRRIRRQCAHQSDPNLATLLWLILTSVHIHSSCVTEYEAASHAVRTPGGDQSGRPIQCMHRSSHPRIPTEVEWFSQHRGPQSVNVRLSRGHHQNLYLRLAALIHASLIVIQFFTLSPNRSKSSSAKLTKSSMISRSFTARNPP
jgi:hypothetical protein